MRHLAVMTVAALVVLTGCTDAPSDVALTSEAPTPTASFEPTPTAEPSATVHSPAPQSEPPTPRPTEAESPVASGPEVELWFVRISGNNTPAGLEPEAHVLDEATEAVARASIEAMLSAKPSDPGLHNLWPEGTRVLDVALERGILTVDVDVPGKHGGLPYGVAYEGHAFQQIVHTGGQFPNVKRVRVLEEGDTFPSGHFDFSGTYRPRRDVLPPVVVTSPQHAAVVDGGEVTVTGNANVYEANVLLRLVDPGGKTVEKTFTTATCGTGCRGTWEHTFEDVTTPGTWTLVAGASDPSDGEGNPPYKVRRTFTVR